MSKEKEIIIKINELREELHKALAEVNGISSEEVLKLSKDLDLVLNKYYSIINSEK